MMGSPPAPPTPKPEIPVPQSDDYALQEKARASILKRQTAGTGGSSSGQLLADAATKDSDPDVMRRGLLVG